MTDQSEQNVWMLDSSTFIHIVMIGKLQLLSNLRTPLCFPEFVFRFELGVTAVRTTRNHAYESVQSNIVSIQQLTLSDLETIAALSAPRRIGLGEIACAIIADRKRGGVLCDDRRAKNWLLQRMPELLWEDIEEFLLDAADNWHISEYDLDSFESILRANFYGCRVNLRQEHLLRLSGRKF